jgi:hypothetical protein
LAILILTKQLPLAGLENSAAVEKFIANGEILRGVAIPPAFMNFIASCVSTAPTLRPTIGELMNLAFK